MHRVRKEGKTLSSVELLMIWFPTATVFFWQISCIVLYWLSSNIKLNRHMALSWLNLVSDDKKRKALLLECHLMCLEVNVAQVQDGRENPKDCWLVLRAEVQDLHGSKQAQEVLGVILSCYSAVSALLRSRTQTEDPLAAIPVSSWEYCWWCCVAAHLVEVIVGLSFLQIERLPLLRGKTRQHLVEDVIVPLILGLTKQTWDSRGQMSRNIKK